MSDTGKPLLDDSMAATLASALAPTALPADRKAALRGQLMARVAAESRSAYVTVRATEGAWRPCGPGLEQKVLLDDPAGRTCMLRLAAGATLPAHDHEEDEECIVLEGCCTIDGELMQRGDFQLARRGSRHGPVHSAAGCVLLVRTGTRTRPEARA